LFDQRRRRSNADVDLHDFIERHVVTTTVVELRGAHGRMRGHALRVFQSAAVFQVGRDPTPGMVANMGIKPGRLGAPLHHPPGFDP